MLLFILLTPVSVSASDETELDKELIREDSLEATFVRTAHSPQKVAVQMFLPMIFNYCTEYGTVKTFGKSSQCGYDTVWTNECCDVCTYCRSCSANTLNRDNCDRQSWANQCSNYPSTVKRSCYYPKKVCLKMGQKTVEKFVLVQLNLKYASELTNDEVENINVKLYQPEIGFDAFKASATSPKNKKPIKINVNSQYKVKIKLKRNNGTKLLSKV
jgi:hypothetical protein